MRMRFSMLNTIGKHDKSFVLGSKSDGFHKAILGFFPNFHFLLITELL